MTRLLPVRGERRALVALVAVVLIAATWWAVRLHEGERTPGVEITGTDERPTEAQARDAAQRLTAALDDLDLVLLDTTGASLRAPGVARSGQTPEQAAAALAGRYRFAEAAQGVLTDEARFLAGLRSGTDLPTAQVIHGSSERLESVVVRREGDGWVVEAAVHGTHPMEAGPVWEQVAPWLLAVDPDGGEVLDLALVPDANG